MYCKTHARTGGPQPTHAGMRRRRVSHPAVTKSGRKRKTAFPTARPVHTVQCICVPPWPVPWATWHSAELTHATRVASHRARAQSTQSSPPAADGDWSTQRALLFAASQSSMALPTPLQHAGRTLLHVERAPSMSASSGQARGVLGPCKKYACRWLGESTRPDP